MKVTGFDDVGVFREFILHKKMNEHHLCTFSYRVNSLDEIPTAMEDEIEVINDDKSLFTGKVSSIEFQQGISENIVTVTLESLSNVQDREKKIRVFHREGQKYEDIVNYISKSAQVDIKISDEAEENELEHAIVQKNETDFEFIKRIAICGYNSDVFSNVNKGTITYYIGNIDNNERELKEPEVYSINFRENEGVYEIIFSIQGNELGQDLRQYIDIGKKISYRNKVFTVSELELKKINGVYRYECVGRLKKDSEKVFVNLRQDTVMFEAKVTNTNDEKDFGRVQLDFSVDEDVEDCSDDEKMWFDVLTPYTAVSGGFVFIPDQDDIVKVLWDGMKFYVYGSLRIEALDDKYKDVSQKQIGNKFEKNICFTDEVLELSSKDSKVVLMDDSIEVIIPDSRVEMTEEDIKIETKNSKIVINDDIVIDTGTLHTDASVVENNIKKDYTCEGKNITLKASSNMVIEGKSKVSIN